jgi:hypothetical protein
MNISSQVTSSCMGFFFANQTKASESPLRWTFEFYWSRIQKTIKECADYVTSLRGKGRSPGKKRLLLGKELRAIGFSLPRLNHLASYSNRDD